jgi:hypothetical protein
MVKACKIIIILVFFYFVPRVCGAQETPKSNNFLNSWLGFDGAMNRYADSLNLIDNRKMLPKFLEDYLLDWEWRNLWSKSFDNEGGPISYRKAIIDRVSREDVLEWIIASSNKSYDKVYEPDKLKSELAPNIYNEFPELPFMESSTRSLAKMRLDEIRSYKSNVKSR